MHRNAPLTPEVACDCVIASHRAGRSPRAAESMNISRQTASQVVAQVSCARELAGWRIGRAGRRVAPIARRSSSSSRSWSCARCASWARHASPGSRGCRPRRCTGCLVRHGCNRLRFMDRPTGRVVRRITTSRCGELVHIDVKKLARIPAGGGHRMLGLIAGKPHQRAGAGYTHIHSAIDAYSRLAYSEFAGPENTASVWRFSIGRSSVLPATPSPSSGSSPTTATVTAASVGTHLPPPRHHQHPHQALPPGHQRQGRALQPHPLRRMGLCALLRIRG